MAKPKVLYEFMAKINNFWVYLNGIQVICSWDFFHSLSFSFSIILFFYDFHFFAVLLRFSVVLPCGFIKVTLRGTGVVNRRRTKDMWTIKICRWDLCNWTATRTDNSAGISIVFLEAYVDEFSNKYFKFAEAINFKYMCADK